MKLPANAMVGAVAGTVLAAAALMAHTGAGAQQAPPLGNNAVAGITAVTQGGAYSSPLDSTPDPSGNTIYFVATSASQGAGVFQVPAAGGTATQIYAGAPFIAPQAIVTGADGRYLYIGDPQAGQVFVLPVGGGMPIPLAGTEGTAPQGLDILTEGGVDQLYIAGVDPATGLPAVLKASTTGDRPPVLLAEGDPLRLPGGVAADGRGNVYVSDQAADGSVQVFQISGGAISALSVPVLAPGFPEGIALSADGRVLLVSVKTPAGDSDRLLTIDLVTGQSDQITTVVAQNNMAGGVHRTRGAQNLFAWADLSAGPNGTGLVYRVEFK